MHHTRTPNEHEIDSNQEGFALSLIVASCRKMHGMYDRSIRCCTISSHHCCQGLVPPSIPLFTPHPMLKHDSYTFFCLLLEFCYVSINKMKRVCSIDLPQYRHLGTCSVFIFVCFPFNGAGHFLIVFSRWIIFRKRDPNVGKLSHIGCKIVSKHIGVYIFFERRRNVLRPVYLA